MTVKELIAMLRGQDPFAEVGLGNDHSHYVQKIATLVTESRPAVAPSGQTLVVIMMADESYVPADEA